MTVKRTNKANYTQDLPDGYILIDLLPLMRKLGKTTYSIEQEGLFKAGQLHKLMNTPRELLNPKLSTLIKLQKTFNLKSIDDLLEKVD